MSISEIAVSINKSYAAARKSTWHGKEKYILSKLSLKIYAEQKEARKSGARGCFVSHRTSGDLMNMLTIWYEEIARGER
jgi:hypothetical protein